MSRTTQAMTHDQAEGAVWRSLLGDVVEALRDGAWLPGPGLTPKARRLIEELLEADKAVQLSHKPTQERQKPASGLIRGWRARKP